mmetsp:Transcript_66079/g.196645  ORF Transcript_66079/g.196645 Transcript_66079/m.196645 type:complete len:277 (-) Transcript_66079:125-955(-)
MVGRSQVVAGPEIAQAHRRMARGRSAARSEARNGMAAAGEDRKSAARASAACRRAACAGQSAAGRTRAAPGKAPDAACREAGTPKDAASRRAGRRRHPVAAHPERHHVGRGAPAADPLAVSQVVVGFRLVNRQGRARLLPGTLGGCCRTAVAGSCLLPLVGCCRLQCRLTQRWSQRQGQCWRRLQLELRKRAGCPHLPLLADFHLESLPGEGRRRRLRVPLAAKLAVGPRAGAGLAARAVTRWSHPLLRHRRPCASSCDRCRRLLAPFPLPASPPG